ncbi:Pls/PosA family non-ribosomal peptide synthetase [Pseudonocardia nigra]|uniref:Pls/PosA family non-ribosomal peptide synthetase n=1 Tax=Pseudonocardia nigra TaxID=1921578 RepID=UPI001C5FAFB7|nr:Pls/PosA family non-ribosomal peptide synthetase [Pseudonocardia nigra]
MSTLQLDAPPVPLSELVLVDQHEAQGRRVRQDERLDHLFEESCDWVRTYGRAGQLAVDSDELSLTYDELDARANRLARYLRLHGAGAGDRIALLFERPTDSYVAMLAVLKIGAAYVPLDVSFAPDRMAYIVEDARVRTVLSMSPVADRVGRIDLLTAAGAELVFLDQAAPLIDEQNSRRLIDAERGVLDDQLAFLIYPAVADGRPHGVAVDHASICNFVKVAAEVYGIRPRDRVYQALSIAFDFSVEEIWVPWVRGATLVPKPAGAGLQGRDLHAFLTSRRVSAMCCVPSVLATLEDDLPGLRFLLVAGQACPPELVARWHRPGRRFLGVYGPTEATVTAAWTELRPDKPPTVGVPLPTYSTVILDVDDPYRALPHGEIGEIGIAGIGLSCGYLNRADLTEKAFIPDFLGIPANPSGRIYRTGDLGRVNGAGEIEHHGRIDLQDPMRGYRVELAEIESLLLRVPEIAQAIVAAPAPAAYADPTTGAEQALAEVLADVLKIERVSVGSHFFADLGADSMIMAQFCARVRKRADLPSVSMKDIYRNPTIRGLATALAEPAPALLEQNLAEVLADIMRTEQVAAGSHFFEDLGADSMVMAQFCARVRKRADLPSVSMKDIYRNPTIKGLATALGEPAPAPVAPAPAPAPSVETTPPVGTPRYVLCGALQLLALLGYPALTALVAVRGIEWIVAGTGALEVYLRSVLFAGASFLGLCLLPVLAKWLLVGRWKPRQIRVWSMTYLRFWFVKFLIRTSPLVLFVGSPLYLLYLRALGAKVGRGAAVFSPHVPVCTDLLTIGEGTVIRKDSFFSGYRAHDGLIQTGAVTLGRNVVVGEATVLDIGTSVGDDAQLGHSSSLHAGQAVPAGECWHGSPAQRTEVNYRTVEPARCGALRKVAYSAVQLLNVLLYLPLVLGSAILLLARVPQVPELIGPGPLAFTDWRFYLQAVAVSYWLFLGSLLVGLLVVVTVPRALALLVRPDTVHPLYGIGYWAHRAIGRMTNVKFFTELFGDSSYIVGFLRSIGYRLSPVEQTGSNFGMAVKHDNPFLSSVGTGTVVADGLSFVNADFSNTSFQVSRVSIGRRNFLGNNIAYPAGGRTGDNCLLATKVMVPLDGEIREGVGLLGSPCFEIPRTVERDNSFELDDPAELRRRLGDKNAHNVATIALRLLTRWVYTLGLTVLAMVAGDLYHAWGAAVIILAGGLLPLVSVGYFVLVERAVTGLKALVPQGCSIYDRAFWRHERYWKVPFTQYMQAFNGTPIKNVIWRLLGVRIGRRVFDDGAFVTEKSFITIGAGCTLNAGTVLQAHSQEDGAFKSNLITIGAGCTIGVNAFVHYGVTIGDGAVLAPDSFLMKGEEVPPGERWGGNPAREM